MVDFRAAFSMVKPAGLALPNFFIFFLHGHLTKPAETSVFGGVVRRNRAFLFSQLHTFQRSLTYYAVNYWQTS